MPIIDQREIAFDAPALIRLIAGSLQRAQTLGLPAARPISIDFNPQEHQIRVAYETHAAVSVTSERLGALLVSYCIRARIPVARLADKDIRIEASAVILIFTTRLADPPATW